MITAEEKAKIESAPILYEWETLAYSGKHTHKIQLIFTLTTFFFLIGCGIYADELIFFTILAIFIPPTFQFFVFADYQYHYYLTCHGYYYTHYQKVPEFGYKLTAIFMVLGVVVAIVGTIVVGPVAFVGGGMFLLTGILGKGLPLGPDLTKIYSPLPYKFKYAIFVITDYQRIAIDTDPMQIKYSCILNCPKEKFEVVLTILKKNISECEIYYVKDEDEFINHPKSMDLTKNRVS